MRKRYLLLPLCPFFQGFVVRPAANVFAGIRVEEKRHASAQAFVVFLSLRLVFSIMPCFKRLKLYTLFRLQPLYNWLHVDAMCAFGSIKFE